jgi:hypothetical protein
MRLRVSYKKKYDFLRPEDPYLQFCNLELKLSSYCISIFFYIFCPLGSRSVFINTTESASNSDL